MKNEDLRDSSVAWLHVVNELGLGLIPGIAFPGNITQTPQDVAPKYI